MPVGDPTSFLDALRTRLSGATAAQRTTFAALLAERQLSRVKDDDAADMRRILAEVWGLARGGALAPGRFHAMKGALEETGALIDPDRFGAMDTYRALRAVARAAACCESEDNLEAALDAARAALEEAAATFASRDLDEALRERWTHPRVQEEAGAQTSLLRLLD
jgi:hypothetical protein